MRVAPRAVSGMTLLELMAAMALMGMALALVRFSGDGISAEWRLRAAAHQVENVVRFAQNAAATRGVRAQVMYDVPESALWVRLPGERQAMSYYALPSGIRFEHVRFVNGIAVSTDVAAAGAFADGSLDPHTVLLTNDKQQAILLSFDRLTGEMYSREGSRDAVAP